MVSPPRFLIVLEDSLQYLTASIGGYYAIGQKSQLICGLIKWDSHVGSFLLEVERDFFGSILHKSHSQ